MLLEHQSRPDRWIRFRLLKYCCRIWDRSRAQFPRERRLRPIVPLVFYQGPGRWRHATEFADSVRAWPWVPRFAHLLVDQSRENPRAVRGRLHGRIAQLIRIITELQANPEAQRLLSRAFLTNEFLGMPARLDHVEKDVAELETDGGYLKSSDLESDLEMVHRRIVRLVSQHMRLTRVRIIARVLRPAAGDFDKSLQRAERDGRIGAEQKLWIRLTNLILRGERQRDGRPLWIAMEIANRIDVKNIVRSRVSADALAKVFAEDAVGAVAGYRIDAADRERAATAGVRCLDVPERF